MSSLKGAFTIHNEEKDETYICWSYEDSPQLTHFEIEYYDEELRKWVKYDGRNGVVPKPKAVGYNY